MKAKWQVVVVCSVVLLSFVPVLQGQDCWNNGDVTQDMVITAGDAQLAFNIVLGVYFPTYEEECAADCNGDGSITAGDAQMIFYAVIGLDACVDPLVPPTPTVTPTFPPAPPGFVYIPPGTFLRGSPDTEACRAPREGPQHSVTLTTGFFIMQTEVTRQMWADLQVEQPTLPNDPSDGTSPTLNHPVQHVSWHDSVLFANLLSSQQGLTHCYYIDDTLSIPVDATNYTTGPFYCNFDANGCRLPTEAEWEYAARADTTGPFSCDETSYLSGNCSDCVSGTHPVLELYCVYCATATTTSEAVGSKLSNPWGLYDIHGNVWEWCWDWYDSYFFDPLIDPSGPDTGSSRVFRGGCWDNQALHARAARRDYMPPAFHQYHLGFRLVRTVQ